MKNRGFCAIIKSQFGIMKNLLRGNIMKMKKFKKIAMILVILVVFAGAIAFAINGIVTGTTKNQLVNIEADTQIEDADCILVLGAGIWGDKPSPMLKERLEAAVKLYEDGVSKKIIMSGDHGREEYDEVNLMKQYAIDKGVPSEDIFMDHAGFSTYESVYRAKEVFQAKKIVIVSQKYHLFRALYLANKLDIESYGVPANTHKFRGAAIREAREVVARNKDFFKGIIKPEPKTIGEAIPVSGNGDVTND